MAVYKSIFSCRVSLPVICIEQASVEVRYGLNLMIVSLVYIPSGIEPLLYEIHGRTTMNVCLSHLQNTDLILAGGFNLLDTSW